MLTHVLLLTYFLILPVFSGHPRHFQLVHMIYELLNSMHTPGRLVVDIVERAKNLQSQTNKNARLYDDCIVHACGIQVLSVD